jgi:hypothetical protein
VEDQVGGLVLAVAAAVLLPHPEVAVAGAVATAVWVAATCEDEGLVGMGTSEAFKIPTIMMMMTPSAPSTVTRPNSCNAAVACLCALDKFSFFPRVFAFCILFPEIQQSAVIQASPHFWHSFQLTIQSYEKNSILT